MAFCTAAPQANMGPRQMFSEDTLIVQTPWKEMEPEKAQIRSSALPAQCLLSCLGPIHPDLGRRASEALTSPDIVHASVTARPAPRDTWTPSSSVEHTHLPVGALLVRFHSKWCNAYLLRHHKYKNNPLSILDVRFNNSLKENAAVCVLLSLPLSVSYCAPFLKPLPFLAPLLSSRSYGLRLSCLPSALSLRFLLFLYTFQNIYKLLMQIICATFAKWWQNICKLLLTTF